MLNNNLPLISIITVVYNGAKTIEQTIQSVLDLTYKNIEYIIIDGGSTDSTIELIRKYEDRISFWISEKDKGLYDAMNKGIGYANGELIGMINSDDWYEANAVDLIVDAYRKNPGKKIFHGDRYDVYETGERKVRKFNHSEFKFKYYSMTYNHPSMFVHRDIYDKRVYNSGLRAYSDYEFVLAQFLESQEVFLYLPICYVNYRLDGISAQMSIRKNLEEGYLARKNAGMNIIRNVFSYALRWAIKRMKQSISL